jgi:hypothetical protein
VECPCCNVELGFDNVSVDRIDDGSYHHHGNVRLTCSACNVKRGLATGRESQTRAAQRSTVKERIAHADGVDLDEA